MVGVKRAWVPVGEAINITFKDDYQHHGAPGRSFSSSLVLSEGKRAAASSKHLDVFALMEQEPLWGTESTGFCVRRQTHRLHIGPLEAQF